MIATDTRFLNKRQAALVLGVSTRTIERLVASGELPAFKLSERVLRFDPDALAAWLDARRTDRED